MLLECQFNRRCLSERRLNSGCLHLQTSGLCRQNIGTVTENDIDTCLIQMHAWCVCVTLNSHCHVHAAPALHLGMLCSRVRSDVPTSDEGSGGRASQAQEPGCHLRVSRKSTVKVFYCWLCECVHHNVHHGCQRDFRKQTKNKAA